MLAHKLHMTHQCSELRKEHRVLAKPTSSDASKTQARALIADLEQSVEDTLTDLDLQGDTWVFDLILKSLSVKLLRRLRDRQSCDISLTAARWREILQSASAGYIEDVLDGVFTYDNLAMPVFDKVYDGDASFMDLMVRIAALDPAHTFDTRRRNKIWGAQNPQASATFLKIQVAAFPKLYAEHMVTAAQFGMYKTLIPLWLAGAKLPENVKTRFAVDSGFHEAISSNHGRLTVLNELKSVEHVIGDPAVIHTFLIKLRAQAA